LRDGLLHRRFGGLGQTNPDGPQRAGVVLGLDRAEPAHHVMRPVEGRMRDELVGETKAGERGYFGCATVRR
jgi:hypothetical protein